MLIVLFLFVYFICVFFALFLLVCVFGCSVALYFLLFVIVGVLLLALADCVCLAVCFRRGIWCFVYLLLLVEVWFPVVCAMFGCVTWWLIWFGVGCVNS